MKHIKFKISHCERNVDKTYRYFGSYVMDENVAYVARGGKMRWRRSPGLKKKHVQILQ